jgi:adenylylsulfate kinase
MTPVYVEASFETCAERDVKGLYAKAAAGGVDNFTGKDSSFEAPDAGDPDWTVTTDDQTEDESLNQLLEKVLPLIKVSQS